MKLAMVMVAAMTSLIFSSVVFGTGQYQIHVIELKENTFSVALLNSYSDYYNQTVEGVYASRIIAEQAGQMDLDSLLNADDAPDPCSHDLNWL